MNPLSFTNLWFVKVYGGFWAWFQWTSRTRKMIWIISLRMFFVFKVEVLEAPEGFKAWFQQSFWTSELKISSRCLGFLVSFCNALGWLLFIGVWVCVSDTWWSLIGDTCHSLIGPLMSSLTCAGLLMSLLTHTDVWLVFAWHLANFYWFLSSDRKPSNNTWFFVIGYILWTW